MTYISLVGTQIMAVLNPLLALIGDGKKPETVVLLATPRALQLAETIQGFLIQNGYAAGHIHIEAISDTLEKDDSERPPAHLPVSDLAAERTPIAFNLAGGMNFQVAACVVEMALEQCTLLYPESEGIHEFHIQGVRPVRRSPGLLSGLRRRPVRRPPRRLYLRPSDPVRRRSRQGNAATRTG